MLFCLSTITVIYLSSITNMLFVNVICQCYLSLLLIMQDGVEHPTSEASQKGEGRRAEQ